MDKIKNFIEQLKDRYSELKAEHVKATNNLEQAQIVVGGAKTAMKEAELEFQKRKIDFDLALEEVAKKHQEFLISEGKVIEFEKQVKDIEDIII